MGFVEHWRKTGGPFTSINGCGNVITNWLGRGSGHLQYRSKVDASEDLDVARATFEAPLLECIGTYNCTANCIGEDPIPDDPFPDDDDRIQMNIAAQVGVAFAGVFGLAGFVFLVVHFRTRRRGPDANSSTEEPLYVEIADDDTNDILSEYYGGDVIGNDSLYRELERFTQVQHLGRKLSVREEAIYDTARVCDAEAEKVEIYQDVSFRKRSAQEQHAHLSKYSKAMSRHDKQYEALFQKWATDPTEGQVWLSYLGVVHNKYAAKLPTEWSQPNPWISDGVDVKSKVYYSRVFDVFSGLDTEHGSPTAIVKAACERCACTLNDGQTIADFEMAPVKGHRRTFEKVRNKDGCFDQIHDYARGMFVVKKGQYLEIPNLIASIRATEQLKVVRAKNRLSLTYNGRKSAGHRDYQLLVATASGWLVEIQILPEEMYEIKQSIGHSDYTEYRYIIEVLNRARDRKDQAQGEGGGGEHLEFVSGATREEFDGFD
jgi:hypothetical protein